MKKKLLLQRLRLITAVALALNGALVPPVHASATGIDPTTCAPGQLLVSADANGIDAIHHHPFYDGPDWPTPTPTPSPTATMTPSPTPTITPSPTPTASPTPTPTDTPLNRPESL